MNETLSSSIWPNFQIPRPNQFSANSVNSWQNNINNNNNSSSSSSELFQTSVDFHNVWSAKSDVNEDRDKDSYIKAIWSTNTSPNHSLPDNIMTLPPENFKHNTTDATPTNSPSMNRSDLIVSNERWGNIKINQTTPWMVCDIDDTEKRTLDPMVWRAKIDGTEVWEEYYTKQHGKRRPQQSDNSFNVNESMWSSTSDISQSTNSLWSNKSSEVSSAVPADIFGSNFFGNGNNHSNFNSTNGVRPSMTRNQAQKYLQEMGFSLSDSIGALVNNQMDLPKALNELQSKYRMSTNGPNLSNSMCNQPISFSNRSADNANITRIPPCTPINPIVAQNSSTIPSMMNSNFSNNIEMFHSDIADQMLDSKYMMNMDQNVTAFNRMPETNRQQSMNITRQDSFRTNFQNSGINSRSMSTNSGPFPNSDMNLLNQNMSRVNMNFNATANMMTQNNSFNIRPNNSNGFSGLHNNNNNSPNLILNNNTNMDVRHNFSGMPNVIGRSFSKPPMFSGMNWHADPSVMSPSGAMPDISQLNLAKNVSCPARLDKVIAIVIKRVQHKHIDYIKTICSDAGAMINFHLNPQAQSIIVQLTNLQDAYRYINIIQSHLSLRVELINNQEEYMHYMSGAN